MDVSTILQLARETTNTSSSMTNLSDSSLLPYLNIVYHDLEDAITAKVDSDYFVKEFYTNTVDGQERYQMREATSTQQWWKKLLEVGIKRDDDQDYYKKLPIVDSNLDDVFSDKDKAERVESDWSVDVIGKYMFVYPAPTTAVTQWLYVLASTTMIDLLVAWSESDIFPDNPELRNFHQLLVIGMKRWIYQLKWQVKEKNDAMNEYEMEKRRMVMSIRNRTSQPVTMTLPRER